MEGIEEIINEMSAKDTSVLCREVMSITDTMGVLRNNGQDDVSTYDHHNLLDNLLIACKWLIHIYIEKAKTAKGTNWEQKFQKPQNENICLTNLNGENKGNFPILTFGDGINWFHMFTTYTAKLLLLPTKLHS